MTRSLAGCLLIALCSTACGSETRAATCRWGDEPAVRLDLRRAADRRHVIVDARRGEEIAIRYADVLRGHRSVHYEGGDVYRGVRDQCLALMSAAIAARHGVQPAQVADAVGRRDDRLDGFLLLIVAALFTWAADLAARRLFDRFQPDEPVPAFVASAAMAVFVSAAGVTLAALGGSVVEMIVVGDTHLSYRVERLPWNQHWRALLAGAAALFAATAWRRWRVHGRSTDAARPSYPLHGSRL
ncbi:MAG: hypothetical protein JWL71_2721 [Acidobacteria bacterium]|nr:hypothetical protein [Acidobacteriota bacterium]